VPAVGVFVAAAVDAAPASSFATSPAVAGAVAAAAGSPLGAALAEGGIEIDLLRIAFCENEFLEYGILVL